MTGQIVCSKKGRDKGRFMAIVEESPLYAYVCDGGKRPLERPKKKNVKHLAYTNKILEADSLRSNKSLKKSLAVYRDSALRGRN